MKPEKEKKNKKSQKVSEPQTTVFPLSFIRQLNAKEQKSQLVSIVEDEMDFFA